MERILISQDRPQLQKTEKELSAVKGGLQQIVNTFIDLNIGTITIDDIEEAIEGPKAFYDKRIDQLVNPPEEFVGGFKRKKSAILAELDLPNPQPFIESIEKYKNYDRGGLNTWDCEIIDNQVQVKPDVYKMAIDRTCVFASTPEAIKGYELLNKVIDAFKELDTYSRANFNKTLFDGSLFGKGLNLDKFFLINGADKNMKINPEYFTRSRH